MGKRGLPPTVTAYLTEMRPGYPMAHRDGRVRVHRAVLHDRIGPGWHPCHWCGRPVTWAVRIGKDALVSDHVDTNTWNNDPANLVPACNACNLHRHLTQRPTCPEGHPWTIENTYERPDGRGRQCRTCNRDRESERSKTRRR